MRALLFLAALGIGACVRDAPETKSEVKTETKSDSKPEGAEPSGRGALAAGALAHLLLPPKEPGTRAFAVEGCAAKPNEEAPATRALPAADTVEASALEGGVLLSHEVAHACCLSAASEVALDGNRVVITETLSGTPCRCRCSSNLRTSVGLKPGKWQVEVKTVSPGKTWTAWTGELSVVK